jgi:hypothetical protein
LLACLLLACGLEREPQLEGMRGDADPFPMDGGNRDDAGMDGGRVDGGAPPSLLDAPEAERLAEVTLDEPIARVVVAGEHTFALHPENSASLLDLSDPTAPALGARLTTTGRVVDLAYDDTRQIAFALTSSGELHAFRLTDPSAPASIGATQIAARGGESWDFLALTRVRDRLFLLSSDHVVPVQIDVDDDGKVALDARTPLAIDSGAQRIAASGTGFFVAFAGGIVRTFSADVAPIALDEVSLGAPITGWSVRGERVVVGLEGSGVREVVLRPGKAVQVKLRARELDDVTALARTGQLAAFALNRDTIVALDISLPATPRALVKHDAAPPAWLAVAGGNVIFGSDDALTVLAVPPFVEAGVPAIRNERFPRYGRIALQLSKPIDPESVAIDTLLLECDRVLAPTRSVLSSDGRRLTVVPTRTLPPLAHCMLDISGVRDTFDTQVTSQDAWLDLTTLEAEPAPVESSTSMYEHTLDGKMSDWAADREEDFEYADLARAEGMLGDLYADYDGERLWLFYDALESPSRLPPSCFAAVSGFAADGAMTFAARLFGDESTHVIAGGDALTARYGFDGTLASPDAHGALELSIVAGEGDFGVQVYAPSDAADCTERQAEPLTFFGSCTADGCSVDATRALAAPPPAASLEPAGEVSVLTPLLRWRNPSSSSIPRYRVTLLDDALHPIYRALVYATQLRVPAGLLELDSSYSFTVRAESEGGTALEASSIFMIVPEEPPPAPCAHSACLPGSVLRSDCSDCASAVCEGDATCCMSGNLWDASCITLAETSSACTCLGPAIASVEPAAGTEGTDTPIELTLTDSDENLEHTLVLTLAGGGDATNLPCMPSADACTATIPGTLPAGTYDLTLRIRESGAVYFSPPATNAFVQAPVTPEP